jgi:purine-nucleoside/S-methyl-5'-thioadenosine phosphorylase / adenosine deaminase
MTFRWTHEAWGAGLRCVPLEPLASHVFTTRQLELSSPDDERRLSAAVGADRVAMLTQVHGTEVVSVRPGECPGRSQAGDALISSQTVVAVAVRVADCVPLLMADRVTGAVAAVHAGWRGTAAGVSRAAVDALGREYGSRPSDLVVAIGPSIGSCCYEVGPELVDAFAAAGHERYLIDRWFIALPPPRGSREQPPLRLDVAGANRDQLILAGVQEGHIHMSGLCTAMHLDVLTSFRAERSQAGRIAAAIRSQRPGVGNR